MSMVKREFIFFLEDMVLAMEHIKEYLGNLEFDQFHLNNMVVDAVIRNFEIIGEATKYIPENVQLKYPEIPWKKMYGLRNLVSHHYFGIDYELIWEIAKKDLPQNYNDLKMILETEKSKS